MTKEDFKDLPMIEDTFTQTEIEEIMRILAEKHADTSWITVAIVATNHTIH
jgi:dTDP-D-glucose 4,6-dehydratase